jgi:hypothetical protein
MKEDVEKQVARRHEEFVRRVCERGEAWTLGVNDEYVTTDSNEYENEEGESLVLFCFWSSEEGARACAVAGWDAYRPVAIPLGKLLEEWCVWMSDEEMVAGVEFDENLVGMEREPLRLIMDLATEARRQGREISLSKYKRLEELTGLVETLLA